jgi:hypothetical protein
MNAPAADAATQPSKEAIDHDRRELLAGAAMGLAAAGGAGILPVDAAPAATNDAIRPFRVDVPGRSSISAGPGANGVKESIRG